MAINRILRDIGDAPVPQFWDEDQQKWVVDKGVRQTQGYGQTEGGVWIPRKVTDDGYDKVQQSERNVLPMVIDASSSATVTAGDSEVVSITPSSGYMGVLKTIYLSANAIAASGTGTHRFTVYINDTPIALNDIQNDEQSLLQFRPVNLFSGNFNGVSTLSDVIQALDGVRFSNTNPLKVKYYNDSDNSNDQTSTRTIKVIGYEEAIV